METSRPHQWLVLSGSKVFMWTRNPGFFLGTRESCLDTSLQDNFSYFTPSQAGYIAKWTQDVSGAAIPGQDFFSSSDLQDMNPADAFELKHDTASEYSMDSTYQSQTGASRRGNTLPEGFQTLTSQDARGRASGQFLGNDIYSPTLSSDNFSAFPEQHPDLGQMQLPSAAGEVDVGDNPFSFANFSTGQEVSQYSSTNVPRFAPASAIDPGYQWGIADAQPFSGPFNFALYSRPSHSIDGSLFSSQDQAEMMFNTSVQPQRQISRPRVDTSVRPVSVRHTSYNTNQQGTRRLSTNEPGFGTFISPASAISTQLPNVAVGDFDQQQREEPRADNEEMASTSLAAQSINDDDEILSASDALEAKHMEEEQSKVARSHPLYQAQPDEDGKYHCPNEGKPGCNHKPTPLKCNYDKYVDSHLKPFRCNKKACVGVQFSSTACLLRHEREAHGMHGHGSRPHLCHFTDCERSVLGNGFPRRYNLFDHMKRVHDYTGPTTESSPPQGQAGTTRKANSRKRKTTAEEPVERRAKVAKPTPQQQLQQKREQLQRTFSDKKQSIINILSTLSGPNDLRDDQQLYKEIVQLHEISAEFKKSTG
ncbi:hypothetical protein CC78DRAFT_564528 [Lojkania enalia]|uniref:Uncharacterized protein n=1 Tax=Lojkania enalia TaxID=147567 RepID=A0A9P4NAV9_9PLEO|nr:hypothetical protein CC78DRAFT_564528 [Didymosphaeria enalia]